ncbi:MAG: hypothetical protein HY044_03005 [Candidatus Woesebacteria bacterium]|nr:MAG: hypothetical protein HY044_03005 [Candidatus Woesebacteria bacterium]
MKNKSIIFTLIYTILGLIGLLFLSKFWLPNGFTIAGHDSGLSLDSKQFLLSRLFAWNPNIGFGVDNSFLFGSLTLHFVDYLSSSISGNIFAGNWLNIFFWLGLIFISAVFFANHFKNTFGEYFVFIFPPLVIFNFYLFQSIFILERAKYSILIGILFFVPILLKFLNKKISLSLASIISAFIFFIFNGGSLLGLSLFGSLFVIIGCIFIFNLASDIKTRNFSQTIRYVVFLLLTAIIFVLLNSYQIFPFLHESRSQSYFDALGGAGTLQSIDWVDYISKNTSLLSLLRLEGVPSWYSDSITANPEHPYASFYLDNDSQILVSFIFPVLAISCFVLYKSHKQKKLLSLFGLIVITSAFLSSGTHPPLGSIYTFLYKHLPGFFIFRNPYYKFAGGYLIGMSVLIAGAFSFIITKINKKFICLFLSFLIICGWITYHYKLLLPDQVFTWKTNFTTKVNIPSYVFDFYKWNNSENLKNGKILLLPKLNDRYFADSYVWKYWSLSPLTYTLATVPGLINEADLNGGEMAWVNKMYSAIDSSDAEEINLLASKLNIRYLLLRNDTGSSEGNQKIQKTLDNLAGITSYKKFGEWSLYRAENVNSKIIDISQSITLTSNEGAYTSREFAPNETVITQEGSDVEKTLSPFANKKIRTYFCDSCLLEQVNNDQSLPPTRVLPNSPLYFLKDRNDQNTINQSSDDSSKIINYLILAFRKTAEVKSMAAMNIEDRYLNIGMQKINEYLANSLALLNKHPELSTNYLMAKQTLNTTLPLLKELQKFVKTREFSQNQGKIGQLVYTEINLLNNLNDYYKPIYRDIDYLKNNKTYELGKETELYLDMNSLSTDKNGKIHKPTTIYYKTANSEEKITLQNTDSRWQKINMPNNMADTAILTLQFDQPDMFVQGKSGIHSFPSGNHGCSEGKIYNFNSDKTYEIKILVNDKAQQLNLFFQNSGSNELKRNVDIYPIEISQPFIYIYHPDHEDNDPTVYICSQDRDLPIIGAISIYELTSPRIQAMETTVGSLFSSNSKISYQILDKTKYLINVDGNGYAFITFAQRFSQFWKLYKIDSNFNLSDKLAWIKNWTTQKQNTSHFIVNGFENGWLINSNDQKTTWVLEYVPQEFFFLGSLVTIFSILAFFLFGVFLLVKEYKHEKV